MFPQVIQGILEAVGAEVVASLFFKEYESHVAGSAAVLAAAEFVDAPGCNLVLHGDACSFPCHAPGPIPAAAGALFLFVDNRNAGIHQIDEGLRAEPHCPSVIPVVFRACCVKEPAFDERVGIGHNPIGA